MESHVSLTIKKVIRVSAIGAVSALEMLNPQSAQATPVTFTGSSVTYPLGGTVQVAITVDGASGTYRITSITTPVQPTTNPNAAYAAFAIPTLTSEALAAQSANINGVSGASQISTAWITSLTSAIAAAASAGERIGLSVTPNPTPSPSVTPTPTPTPTVTPTPTPTRSGKRHKGITQRDDERESEGRVTIKIGRTSGGEHSSREHD